MTQRSEPFFMVYGLGQGAPNFVHATYQSARAEAERLAEKHPGVAFYVLGTMACAQKISVQFRTINPDELPF